MTLFSLGQLHPTRGETGIDVFNEPLKAAGEHEWVIVLKGAATLRFVDHVLELKSRGFRV